MGLVIQIMYRNTWSRVYFVQDLNTERAKRKAFDMFKEIVSCRLPDTLEEAESDDNFYISVVTEVRQIIL